MKNWQFVTLLLVNIIGFIIIISSISNHFNNLESMLSETQEKAKRPLINIGNKE